MKRIRLSTLLLLVVIAALVTALIVQGRRIAKLESAAAPTLKSWRMVAEKRSAEIEIGRQMARANGLNSGVGKD
jgi:hypothetical protein